MNALNLTLAVLCFSHLAFGANPIELENSKPGTDQWKLSNPASQNEIEGYASLTSVNRGGQIDFFVNSKAPRFKAEVFRMGWYGGLGARLVPVKMEGLRGVRQAIPSPDPETRMVECNWEKSFSLDISGGTGEWVSGYYLVKLTSSQGKESYIPFVVRDDARPSKILFQSSVTTFQAYNNWGGHSLYDHNSNGEKKATRVSFNRPYAKGMTLISFAGLGAGEFLTNVQPAEEAHSAAWEYNMVRFLERKGIDVTYSTNIDTHADPQLLLKHQTWLSVGHDEYWSWEMRDHVEQARDSGVNLGFFSSNTAYWQVRLEPSEMTGGASRTMVCHKWADSDPVKGSRSTVKWRDVGRPESEMLGIMYVKDPADGDFVIKNTNHWIFNGTGLKPGDKIPGLLGYEVDQILGDPKPGLHIIAESPWVGRRWAPYNGVTHATIYQADSGAHVLAVGSMNFNFALDDWNRGMHEKNISEPLQRMTCNFLLLGGSS